MNDINPDLGNEGYETADPCNPTRNGKIAALNRDIRECLNRQIRAKRSGTEILGWLNVEPAVRAVLDKDFAGQPINSKNLSQWRHGGYHEWEQHQAACARRKRQEKEAGGKGVRHDLGDELAELYAEELEVTLDDLLVMAPDAKARWQHLDKGLDQIRGWRRSDCQARRLALEEAKWQRRCQLEDEAQEKAEEEKLRRRMYVAILAQLKRQGKAMNFLDRLEESQHDLDLLHLLQCDLDQFDERRRKALANQSPSPAEKVEVPGGQFVEKGHEAQNTKHEGENTKIQTSRSAGTGSNTNLTPSANIQQPTSNIEHPVEEQRANIQPSTMASQARHEMDPPSGERATRSVANAQHSIGEEKENIQQPAKEQAPKVEAATITAQSSSEVVNGQSPAIEALSEKEKIESEAVELQGSPKSAKAGESENKNETKPSEPEPGTYTAAEAEKVIEALREKGRNVGLCPPDARSHSTASLKAYLTGQPAQYYSLMTCDVETMQPPGWDPRKLPKSEWFEILKKWERLNGPNPQPIYAR